MPDLRREEWLGAARREPGGLAISSVCGGRATKGGTACQTLGAYTSGAVVLRRNSPSPAAGWAIGFGTCC